MQIDSPAQSKITSNDGDWSSYYVNMKNTPEAGQMIRFGDIDNLGFGFQDVDPFTQISSHTYPWTRDTNDSLGLDMIMISSGGRPSDGYSSRCKYQIKKEYGQTYFPIIFPLSLDSNLILETIVLQVHFDDVQALVHQVKYRAYINNRRASFMEKQINKLDQSGPKGQIVSFVVPKKFFDEFTSSEFSFYMDNSNKENCEGYAIDFIKILYNPINIPEPIKDKPTKVHQTIDSVQTQKIDSIRNENKLLLEQTKQYAQTSIFNRLTFIILNIFLHQGGGTPSPSIPSGGATTPKFNN